MDNESKETKGFPAILKMVLAKKHITQGTLAEETGLSNATITNYIRGKYTPSQKTLEKIASYLNVSPKIFYEDEDSINFGSNGMESDFSERLYELIKRNNETQESVAKAIKVSRQTVNYYINGKTFPTDDVMQKICEHFHVNKEYFFENNTMARNKTTMRIIVNEIPKEKGDCVFICKNKCECKFGGLCDIENCTYLLKLSDANTGVFVTGTTVGNIEEPVADTISDSDFPF